MESIFWFVLETVGVSSNGAFLDTLDREMALWVLFCINVNITVNKNKP